MRGVPVCPLPCPALLCPGCRYGEDEGHSRSHWQGVGTRVPQAFASLLRAPPPTQPEGLETFLNLRPLVGLAGLRTLVLGGRPAGGHEALATLTGDALAAQRSAAPARIPSHP